MPIEVGGVRGTTSNVGADNVVFASPASFAVGAAIRFVISTPAGAEAPLRVECSGVVTGERAREGGFETSATIETVHIVPLER